MEKNIVAACLQEVCKELLEKKDELNELDAVMGDGEHGSNIDRTFGSVLAQYSELKELEPVQMIDKTGSILLAAGGGTATTLMGFACKKTAALAKNKKVENAEVLADVMRKTWESISTKSQALPGDKTLMDAYTPAIDAFEKKAGKGGTYKQCFAEAATAALNGAEATKEMIAKRGRGYYVGERGLGVQDPGATSIATIFQAISKEMNKGEQ